MQKTVWWYMDFRSTYQTCCDNLDESKLSWCIS
jgi:hypothetical protein